MLEFASNIYFCKLQLGTTVQPPIRSNGSNLSYISIYQKENIELHQIKTSVETKFSRV